MIFVDTGAWFALSVPSDINHHAAVAFFGENDEAMCTSNYVIDETLTLIRRRGEPHRALTLGTRFFAGEIARIFRLTEPDEIKAWEVFKRFADKEWSFTDCTSRVLMERMGVTQAFAFDDHFRQFGTVTVYP